MARSEFVGVDGCKGGWFSVGFDQDGCCETEVFPTFCELLAHYSGAKLILVDIPIGLPEGREGVIATARPVKKLGGHAHRASSQRRLGRRYNRRC